MKIAFFSDNYMPGGETLDPFRAQFFKALCRIGGEILYIQSNDFQNPDGGFLSNRSRDKVLSSLQRFEPEVVISLNRAGLSEAVQKETKASFLSWYIDNPNRFSPSLRKFSQGETIFCATKYMCDWLSKSAPEVSCLYLPFCTDEELFSPHPAVPDSAKCDVSFVGTLWEPSPFLNMVQQMARTPDGQLLVMQGLNEYLGNYDSDFPIRLKKIFPEMPLTLIKNTLDDFLSSRRRLDYLEAISDLDVQIYGTSSWLGQSVLRSDRLFEKFKPTPLETPEALASLYRHSRVAISIAHQQAQSGFPIRIFDILGTGTPLVSDFHRELGDLFEDGKCFLAAGSAEEASEAVRRLIKDTHLAKRMSGAAVDAVRSHHTFAHRLKTMTGKDLGPKGASVIQLLSDRLSTDFLISDPRFQLSEIRALAPKRSRTPQRVSAPSPGRAVVGSLNIIKKLIKIAGLTAYVSILMVKFGLVSLVKRREGSLLKELKRIGEFSENMVRQHQESLLIQARTLLVQLSLLKDKN